MDWSNARRIANSKAFLQNSEKPYLYLEHLDEEWEI